MKILGIDSGLRCTGWGVIDVQRSDIAYVSCGVIKTTNSDRMEKRLKDIYDGVSEIIKVYNPESISMEEVFINLNPASSKKLIMSRTAAYLACCNFGYLVNEFSPNTIKKNITGNGHASKDQILLMVQKLLKININKTSTVTSDAIDAVAIAVCYAFSRDSLSRNLL
jgi:crossover junction endodeoxyribonuclease RuvC